MDYIRHFHLLTQKANRIILTTHAHPDADGLGAQIALCLALRSLNKDVICVIEEELIDRYKYLDPDNCILSAQTFFSNKKEHAKNIDLFIVLDSNDLARVGRKIEQIALRASELLFIDHHPASSELTSLHCIDTSKAATGELVADLIISLKVSFTKPMAIALYTAILIDTNCFRYRSVTQNTHSVVAQLLATGIHPHTAYSAIYGAKTIEHLRLLGSILNQAKTNNDGTIAWMIVDENMLSKSNISFEDTHAYINHLLVLDNIKVACMFRQTGKFVKISMRSTGLVDVAVFSQALGGGGHAYSAATIIEGSIEEIVTSTISKIEIMLKAKGQISKAVE